MEDLGAKAAGGLAVIHGHCPLLLLQLYYSKINKSLTHSTRWIQCK